MDFSLFHFAQPHWLWGLAVIPLLLAAHAVMLRRQAVPRRLGNFADKHLLPHLVKHSSAENHFWRPLLIWPMAFALGTVALAGPQWRYTDTQIFKPENDLVIVLDMSGSMNAADLKPSRLARAREKISDLLDANKGVTIGLVAYAAVPHMVVPLTDDMNTIRNLLPSLDTSLITIDGDRLKPALAMAAEMLKAEPGHDKSILVISDGDFVENDAADLTEAASGARIYTMGVGSTEGAPVPLADGSWAKDKTGRMLIDPLHADRLAALAHAGNGFYAQATYGDSDTRALLNHFGGGMGDQKLSGRTVRVWDEGFYMPTLLLALLLLPLFRKHAPSVLLILFAFALSTQPTQAADAVDWFRNPDQQGQAAFAQGNYGEAAQKFADPYQRGVAAYKAGQYAQAAALFKTASDGPAGSAAAYNLGNAQLMQSQPQAAIDSYQSVLRQKPNDVSAKHNLGIAEKMLQQQKQQEQEQQADQSKKNSQPQKENQSGGQDKQEQQAQQNGQKQGSQQNQGQQKSASTSPGKESGSQAASDSQQNQDGKNKSRQDGQKAGNRQQNAQQASQQPGQQQQAAGQHSAGEPSTASNSGPEEENQASQMGKQNAQSSADQQNQEQAAARSAPTSEEPPRNSAIAANQNTSQSASLPPLQTNASAGRSRRDIEADQWLNHIQSDPGLFLRNQFMIEERENIQKEDGQNGESPPS
jgi:Ca-activated chloride channel family protein